MDLSSYTSLCDAMVELLNPLLEVVIHDLTTGKITYINGNLSKRQVGDPSLLYMEGEEPFSEASIVYPKLSYEGKLIKSISVPLKKNSESKFLICINCDISIFNQMQLLSSLFLKCQGQAQPESLFKNDWQERVHVAIHKKLKEKQWHYHELKSSQKKQLAYYLYNQGAFEEKNAADYISKTLNLGRATIFKYLREWRENDN